MGALTAEERRRVFLARQEANRPGPARLSAPVTGSEPHAPRRRLNTALKTAIVITLLGVGGFAVHVVEFHIPASIAEALPRL